MDAQIHPATPSSEGAEGPCAQPLVLFLGTLTYDMNRAVATTIMLLHLSVFLFLVGLVIFFFTIHKIVAIVVSISVGLFEVVYLMLTLIACIDHSCPYHTPLSDVWWSQRGHT